MLKKNEKKLLGLFGHFPPPRGGVGAHLLRLHLGLLDCNIDHIAWSFGHSNRNISTINHVRSAVFSFAISLIRGYEVLHYHTDEKDWKAAVAVWLWSNLRNQPYMLTVHSFRTERNIRRNFIRYLVRRAYLGADQVICVSNGVRDSLNANLSLENLTTLVISAFIPPTKLERSGAIDPRIRKVLDHSRLVICFNAFKAIAYNGMDLYGTDVAMEAFQIVAAEQKGLSLILVFATAGKGKLWEKIQSKAKELQPNVCLIDDHEGEFVPILERAQIFLRPTLNDGASVSVREALAMGKWCIASDSVERPDRTILFQSQNANDLARALRETIVKVQKNEKSPKLEFNNTLHELITLYNSFHINK